MEGEMDFPEYILIYDKHSRTDNILSIKRSGDHRDLHSFPTRRSSDLDSRPSAAVPRAARTSGRCAVWAVRRSEEHTSELHKRENIVCRLLLVKKNIREAF